MITSPMENVMQRTLIVFFVAVSVLACGRPGPANFDKFTANENGVRQLRDFIVDGSNPMDHRVEALVTLIEAGWTMRTRSILDGCRDGDEVSAGLAGELVGRLPGLSGEPRRLAPVRDAVFISLSRIPPDRRDAILKRVAAWAFQDLEPDSTAERVKEVVEPRILINQVTELGRYGIDGALAMIRHGFGVDKLAGYVAGQDDPELDARLLEAFKALHAVEDIVINFTHIDAIGKIESYGAVNHLLALADDKAQDPDTRAVAFNAAMELLDSPDGLSGKRGGILMRLRKLLGNSNADDRWSSARFLIGMEGLDVMPEVLGALKDDGVYPRAFEDPIKTMVDFCRDVVFGKVEDAAAWNTVDSMLRSRNKVHRTLGVICVKTSGDHSRSTILKRLVRSRSSLEDVLGEQITLGRLAVNAREGLAMMKEVDDAMKAGDVPGAEAEKRKFVILVDMLDVGNEYRLAVEQRLSRDTEGKSGQ